MINTVNYIIIVNYKTWEDTLDCLIHIESSTPHNFRVIVVDNDSGNDSIRQIRSNFNNDYQQEVFEGFSVTNLLKYNFLQSKKNLGFAGGNNLIIRSLYEQSPDSFVLLLNPDMVLQPEALNTLSKESKSNTIMGGVIKQHNVPNKVVYFGGASVDLWRAGVVANTSSREKKELQFINGGLLYFPLSIVDKIGLMPENYFLYWEEADWCLQAIKRGISISYNQKVIGFDKGATSIGRGKTAFYYFTRNGLFFVKKYGNKSQILTTLGFRFFWSLTLLLKNRKSQFKGSIKGIWHFVRNIDGPVDL